MLTVIELAQILAGALDENFHIINPTAVLRVVTCLEAFNITHESYREVQNTRIIKDLQALRQNKGNDQILAKRIKNLLRKWKERLAATPQLAPLAQQSSQPNSPQNMSQGSSDTQFMTQHSQSPPISQLRTVNGPTSFTNLLPKSHPSSMLPITSPITQIPYQNGIQDASKLLGKRKLDTRASEMDENSNHSRRKLMKKSSPVKPFVIPNNNNNLVNHNNSASQASVVPVTTTHQVQVQSPPIPLVPEAIPKKRGRKKGSKGIDSMLNGAVPDFQAEIQQKIALSAGKRNKTTIELQQMLESNQSTAVSWANGDVDSNSLDRGPNSTNHVNNNHHYHNNDTSQASHASISKETLSKKNTIKKEETKGTSSEFIDKKSEDITKLITLSVPALTVEEEIAKFRSLLPPIDYEAAARDMFDEYNIINEYGDFVECTCTFREVVTYLGEEDEIDGKPILPPSIKDEVLMKNGNGKDADESDDEETDDFCAVDEVDDVLIKSPPSPPLRGAVKSIFDPEYDANENLIEEMVRRKPNTARVIEVKVQKEAVKSSRIEPIVDAVPLENLERVPVINFVCDEDPMCPARAHFQKDPVQQSDVDNLHQSLLAGINGNWNGVPEEKPPQDFSKDNEQIDYAKHRLWKRVVPKYDFLTCDRVPKTFDDGSPFSKPSPLIDEDGNVEDIKPFNGFNANSIDFREWHECVNVRSYNDEVLTILPYVIID